MWSPRHRMQIAFDFETMDVPLDPNTYREHLVFATEYQLAMYRLGGRSKRDETRPHVMAAMDRYSLMQLRALFLFALKEHKREVELGRRLHELERGELWVQLADDGHIEFPERGAPPVATDKANTVKYSN